jgi:hypothetical protein
MRIARCFTKELPVKNVVYALVLSLGVVSCAVSGQDDATATEGTATSAVMSTPDQASAKPEATVRGDELNSTGTGPTTNANGNGQYCYTLCSNGAWYVNTRITVNCDAYGQNEVCPHRGLAWWGADWCKPTTESCPTAFLL